MAGNTVAMGDSYSAYAVRNIFVSVIDKSLGGEVVYRQLTNYETTSASTPHLVRITDENSMILWKHDGKLNYCILDADGALKGKLVECDGALSDCSVLSFTIAK